MNHKPGRSKAGGALPAAETHESRFPYPEPIREIPPDIQPSYEAYVCRVNALSPTELFDRYGRAGFLYSAKMERLAPFMPKVADNWRKRG
jgi:hypothetical protein